MTIAKVAGARIDVSPYRPEDEGEVLELLASALGGGPAGRRTPELFRWKHLANSAGPSLVLVARAEGTIAGLRSFMRWRLRADGSVLRGARAVDTATHPRFQRMGIFSRLTAEALDLLAADTDLVFNTPNGRSLPGYLKLGWTPVGAVPVRVRMRRPVSFVRGLRSIDRLGVARPDVELDAPVATELLRDAGAVDRLLVEARTPGRIETARDADYLRWRYGAPELGYRAVERRRGSELEGLAFFRIRSRGALTEATVADLVVRSGDQATARRLLRHIAHVSPVDHLTCSFPPRSAAAQAAVRSGFLASPKGMTLVTRPLRTPLAPDPCHLSSWALTLGDLEVF
jgi:GNAT superfamily N-acetyltransferase